MQMHIKQLVVRIFFVVCIIVCLYICIFGTHGLLKLRALEEENRRIVVLVNKHEEELCALKKLVSLWHDSSFLKEKEAREKLHMAYKDDVVYYIQKE
ncbi:MAG TPA: septum formation initiator family protein [Patescibacteria group bacterium]|nr:septum formation initiator family protein [Patescibacteria group bacterium]